jgi:hypothetical protein
MKLGMEVFYKAVGFRHVFPEKRRHDNHTLIKVVNSFLPVFSIFFGANFGETAYRQSPCGTAEQV